MCLSGVIRAIIVKETDESKKSKNFNLLQAHLSNSFDGNFPTIFNSTFDFEGRVVFTMLLKSNLSAELSHRGKGQYKTSINCSTSSITAFPHSVQFCSYNNENCFLFFSTRGFFNLAKYLGTRNNLKPEKTSDAIASRALTTLQINLQENTEIFQICLQRL